MKKRTLFTLIIMSLCGFVWAQNTDGGATELMRAVSDKYQAYNAMKFHYTLKVTKDNKTLNSSQGDFALRGNRYRASYGGQEFFCDGTTIWNYQKSTNEVSIYEYDPEDDENLMNPQRILKDWEKQFRAKFIRDEFVNNVSVSLVDMTPKVSQSFYRIRLFVNKSNRQIVRIAIYEKDNTIYTYYIEQFNSNATFPDNYFAFDKSKYPGVEVNDMR